jgi:ABC-2 type transport system ATP-binding protein
LRPKFTAGGLLMMTPAIATDRLSKDFPIGFWRKRPYRALDALTLEVQPGEIFGFLGPNGAGKTTTLKLLMQLIYPTSGEAYILGQPAGDLAVRHRIGYLPENPYFYDYLTAEELLIYFAGLFGLTGAARRARVAALLDEVGLGAERRLQLRKFSKGMVQRVGIAQALINDPDVVVLDEPMSGLDPLGRHSIRALILRLRERGKTVFFSSHILSDAEALCSRVAILAGGRLAAMGSVSDMLGGEVRGWELVVTGIARETVDRVAPRLSKITAIADGRYVLELQATEQPAALVGELASAGASIVSLNPLHATLEEIFVSKVQAAGSAREGAPA